MNGSVCASMCVRYYTVTLPNPKVTDPRNSHSSTRNLSLTLLVLSKMVFSPWANH